MLVIRVISFTSKKEVMTLKQSKTTYLQTDFFDV